MRNVTQGHSACFIGPMDGTGGGLGDDIYGSLLAGSAASSIRRQSQESPQAFAFGGGPSSTPAAQNPAQNPGNSQPQGRKVPGNQVVDGITDFLADFDDWGIGSQRNSPSPQNGQQANQQGNQNLGNAPQPSQVPPAPTAQGAAQQGTGGAESPSALHPAVGEFRFNSLDPNALATHYSKVIPANLFEFSAAEQQQLANGDYSPFTAKSAAMQTTLTQALSVAVQDVMNLVQDQLKPNLSKSFEAFTRNATRESALDQATSGQDRGSLQFLAKSVAEQYLQRNPNATPQQVSEATKRFMEGLKVAFTQQNRPATVDQPMDWSTF